MNQLMEATPIQKQTFTVNVDGEVVTANPVGRPTAYDPSFCEKAIEL